MLSNLSRRAPMMKTGAQALLKSYLVGVCVFFQDARPTPTAASAHFYLPGHAVQKSLRVGERALDILHTESHWDS